MFRGVLYGLFREFGAPSGNLTSVLRRGRRRRLHPDDEVGRPPSSSRHGPALGPRLSAQNMRQGSQLAATSPNAGFSNEGRVK
jgi:hypothetical protein